MHTFDLKDGVLLDGKPQKKVVLKDLTAQDLINASSQSEVLKTHPQTGDSEIHVSPTLLSFQLIVSQITSIGDMNIVGDNIVSQLSQADWAIVQYQLELLDSATNKQLEDFISRGKLSAASAPAPKNDAGSNG